MKLRLKVAGRAQRARIVSGLQPEVNFAFAGMPKGSAAVPALAASAH
ncbi:MAG: hypothetical protein ACK47V_16000 [Betaproteobacteria bacterium]